MFVGREAIELAANQESKLLLIFRVEFTRCHLAAVCKSKVGLWKNLRDAKYFATGVSLQIMI